MAIRFDRDLTSSEPDPDRVWRGFLAWWYGLDTVDRQHESRPQTETVPSPSNTEDR